MPDDPAFAPTGLQTRQLALGAHTVRLTTYRAGDRWACKVDNVDPGTVIGRGLGSTRDAAEASALESAELMLNLKSAREAIHRSVGHLKGDRGRP